MGNLSSLFSLLLTNVLAAGSVLAQVRPRPPEKEITFKISVPLEFKGRVVSRALRQPDIVGLLDLPVRNGDTNLKGGYGVEVWR